MVEPAKSSDNANLDEFMADIFGEDAVKPTKNNSDEELDDDAEALLRLGPQARDTDFDELFGEDVKDSDDTGISSISASPMAITTTETEEKNVNPSPKKRGAIGEASPEKYEDDGAQWVSLDSSEKDEFLSWLGEEEEEEHNGGGSQLRAHSHSHSGDTGEDEEDDGEELGFGLGLGSGSHQSPLSPYAGEDQGPQKSLAAAAFSRDLSADILDSLTLNDEELLKLASFPLPPALRFEGVRVPKSKHPNSEDPEDPEAPGAETPGARSYLQVLVEYLFPVVGESAMQAAADTVRTRMETLIDISEVEPQSLHAALYVDKVGELMLEDLRLKIWYKLLRVGNGKLDDFYSNKLQTGLVSLSKQGLDMYKSRTDVLKRDCRNILQLIRKSDCDNSVVEAILADLLRTKTNDLYNVLLCNLIVMIVYECEKMTEYSIVGMKETEDEYENENEAENKYKNENGDEDLKERQALNQKLGFNMLLAICDRWGGGKGDWSSTGLSKPNSKFVGGAAWCKRTVPSVSLRRHTMLRVLVNYHDPVLGIHLDKKLRSWKVESLAWEKPLFEQLALMIDAHGDNGEQNEEKSGEKNGEKGHGYPSSELFGLFALMDEDGSFTGNSPQVVERFWDACLLRRPGFENPQSASFFLALALLVLDREEIVRASTHEEILPIVRSIPARLLSDGKAAAATTRFAVRLAQHTPEYFKEQLAEEELLIGLPPESRTGKERENLHLQRAQDSLFEIEEENDNDNENDSDDDNESNEVELLESDEESRRDTIDLSEIGEGEDKVDSFEKVEEPEDMEASGGTAAMKPVQEKAKETLANTSAWLKTVTQQFSEKITSARSSASSQQVSSEAVLGAEHEQLLVVFPASDKKLGIRLTRSGKTGLVVAGLEEGGQASAASSIHIGDIVVTVNGLLVVGLEPESARALIALQDRPLYVVVSRKKLAGDADGSGNSVGNTNISSGWTSTSSAQQVPGLQYRLMKYYLKHNTGKMNSVNHILRLYKGHEAVLLEELAIKYESHVMGDPHRVLFSRYCVPVSAKEVVAQLCGEHDPSCRNNSHGVRFFVVDCRPEEHIKDTGRFPTCFVLGPDSVDDQVLDSTFEAMRGRMHLCLLGAGSHALLREYNPAKSRRLKEIDRRNVDFVASYFLKRGFPFVGVIKGGFVACHRAIREAGLDIDDCLVDYSRGSSRSPSRSRIQRYDAYLRFRKSSRSQAAAFLARTAKQKAKLDAQHGDLDDQGRRRSVALSFSSFGVDPSSSVSTASEKVGAFFSSIVEATTKKSNSPPAKEITETCVRDAESEKTLAGEVELGVDPGASKGEGEGEGEGKSSSWANWDAVSSRLKDFREKTSTEFTQKLKTNEWGEKMKQAFAKTGEQIRNTAAAAAASSRSQSVQQQQQQQLGSSPGEALFGMRNAESRQRKRPSLEEDEETVQHVSALKKGDMVEARSMGKYVRFFAAEKEKREENISHNFVAKRTLAVSCFRLLVLENHPMRPGTAIVKSNRSLSDVVRIRFHNDNPTVIAVFFNKNGELCNNEYRFKNPNNFLSVLQYACAVLNRNKKEKEAQRERKSDAEKDAQDDQYKPKSKQDTDNSADEDEAEEHP